MDAKKTGLVALILAFILSACNSCNNSDENNNGRPDTDAVASKDTQPSVCSADPDTSALEMTTIFQEQGMWCWAACGEMVMEFMGTTDIKQCDEVNSLLRATNCCESPPPFACDSGGIPEFEKNGFVVDSVPRALTWEELKEQIACKKSPICAIWQYVFGGSHMVVASGYTKVDGENYVIIRDPEQDESLPIRFIKYEDYDTTSFYRHGMDYYNITQKK